MFRSSKEEEEMCLLCLHFMDSYDRYFVELNKCKIYLSIIQCILLHHLPPYSLTNIYLDLDHDRRTWKD